MTIEEYFAESNHVAGRIWRQFDARLREAASAQAIRQIEHYLGGSLPTGNPYLYACYEQALHVLKASGVALDHDNNRPDFIPPDSAPRTREPAGSPNEICAAALAWIHGLGADGTRTRPLPAVTLERG